MDHDIVFRGVLAEMTFCSKEHVAAYFGAYIE